MFYIKKLRDDNVLHFAAEELKKYLRMMMPECGEIEISTAPGAKDGFRLGLLEDFGIPNEAPDADLDDIVHIDTTAEGGILAGSNPRSVLFAVYRFLKENGCRFLFPGTDGEYIPRKPVEAIRYHKMADCRFRGHTTEGDPSLEMALDYIDYQAKQEMNVYGLYGIYNYHRRYYLHRFNEKNRPPEPVERDLVEQWYGLCEAELLKRGIQIWAGGHGFMPHVLGVDPEDRYLYKSGQKELPEELRENCAMMKGVRGLNRKDPMFTNFCMSRADLRSKYADLVVARAEKNPQLSQLAVSLADTNNNHCECPERQKKRPSDFYVMLLNEIDEKLTAKGIQTKISFSAYVDCMFAPEVERIKNPSRFALKATPIGRTYERPLCSEADSSLLQPYVRNNWTMPRTVEAYYAHFKQWQDRFPGTCTGYEYHYWVKQYRDPGMMAMSRLIYDDVLSWKALGLDGGIEDGSNRSFFPNGFVDHIYGATLLDNNLDYEAELADYYSHIYGPDWKKARAYLDKITEAFDPMFMWGKKSADPKLGEFYNPAQAEKLEQVKEITAEAREFIKTHLAMPTRPQTVSWRLLLRHTEWCDRIAEVIIEVCKGHKKYAKEMFLKFAEDFGKYEYEMERYFDFGLSIHGLDYIVKNVPKVEF
jgi:hypothetical protein